MLRIRKTVFTREVIATDATGQSAPPVTRAAVAVVVSNPLAGRFEQDLSALFAIGAELGETFAAEVAGLLPGKAVSYGKAAIVGVNGDMEQGGAVVHPRLGAPMRAAVGGGAAVIPSNVKLGGPGTAIDVPLGHKDDPWSFDHFDTLTLAVPDAPLPDEILVVIAYADGGRLIPRCGKGPATAS